MLFNVVLVETYNLCTRRCWFCKFGQTRQDTEVQTMSNETLLRIVDNLHQLNYSGRISPFGINEPLLDPRLVEMIQLFRTRCPRSFLSFNTNGDRLTPALFAQLMDNGLDTLGLSIYDDLGFNRLQPYAQDPRVVMLDMRQPGQRLENRGGQVQNHPDRFHPEQFSQAPCYRPLTMLVIRPTGDVVLCCSDMYSDVVMGNIWDSRLEEIWFSEAFHAYRRDDHASDSPHRRCRPVLLRYV